MDCQLCISIHESGLSCRCSCHDQQFAVKVETEKPTSYEAVCTGIEKHFAQSEFDQRLTMEDIEWLHQMRIVL